MNGRESLLGFACCSKGGVVFIFHISDEPSSPPSAFVSREKAFGASENNLFVVQWSRDSSYKKKKEKKARIGKHHFFFFTRIKTEGELTIMAGRFEVECWGYNEVRPVIDRFL